MLLRIFDAVRAMLLTGIAGLLAFALLVPGHADTMSIADTFGRDNSIFAPYPLCQCRWLPPPRIHLLHPRTRTVAPPDIVCEADPVDGHDPCTDDRRANKA